MDEKKPQRREGLAAEVAENIGAFTKGRRAHDSLIRQGWARFGLIGLVVGTMFIRQEADRREARADRQAEREDRQARDANLAAAIINLDKDIVQLRDAADRERELCWQVRRLRAGK